MHPSPAEGNAFLTFQKRIGPFWWLVMLVLTGYWTLLSAQNISTANIKGDAGQNLDIAAQIYQTGEFSMHMPSGLEPTNLREPLPILVTALYFMASGRQPDQLTFRNLRTGEPARFVKMHNLGWVFIGLVTVWLLFNALTSTRWGGGLAAGITFIFFFNNPYIVDSLYTELATSVLMLVVSGLMLLAYQRRNSLLWLATGLGMGLLCLTKSAFLYIALVAIVLMAAVMLVQRHERSRPLIAAGLMALGLVVTTAPWMIRNQIMFDSAQISSGRGGWVLYKRALLNQITPEEFRLAFTLFGPRSYQALVEDTSLALKPEDAKLRTGRMSRLFAGASEFSYDDMVAQAHGEPDRAISLYRKTSAMHNKLARELKQAGHPFPEMAADKQMQSMAMGMLAEHPLAHLKLTSLMFWRGMWSLPPQLDIPLLPGGRWRAVFIESLNGLAVLALLGYFAYALIRQNIPLLAFTALPVLMMAFYTLLSQNLPRFFAPTQPMMLMAVLLLLFHALRPRSGRTSLHA